MGREEGEINQHIVLQQTHGTLIIEHAPQLRVQLLSLGKRAFEIALGLLGFGDPPKRDIQAKDTSPFHVFTSSSSSSTEHQQEV